MAECPRRLMFYETIAARIIAAAMSAKSNHIAIVAPELTAT
jgi:hypothetical protein